MQDRTAASIAYGSLPWTVIVGQYFKKNKNPVDSTRTYNRSQWAVAEIPSNWHLSQICFKPVYCSFLSTGKTAVHGNQSYATDEAHRD